MRLWPIPFRRRPAGHVPGRPRRRHGAPSRSPVGQRVCRSGSRPSAGSRSRLPDAALAGRCASRWEWPTGTASGTWCRCSASNATGSGTYAPRPDRQSSATGGPHRAGSSKYPPAERPPIIRRYLQTVPGARPHIPVDRHAPDSQFQAISPRYPVFRVVPAQQDRPRPAGNSGSQRPRLTQIKDDQQ